MLFLSVDGIADSVSGGHPHGDGVVHGVAADPASSSSDSTPESHCEHCCHGHSASIASPSHARMAALRSLVDHGASGWCSIRNIGQAPPTPPPTA